MARDFSQGWKAKHCTCSSLRHLSAADKSRVTHPGRSRRASMTPSQRQQIPKYLGSARRRAQNITEGRPIPSLHDPRTTMSSLTLRPILRFQVLPLLVLPPPPSSLSGTVRQHLWPRLSHGEAALGAVEPETGPGHGLRVLWPGNLCKRALRIVAAVCTDFVKL